MMITEEILNQVKFFLRGKSEPQSLARIAKGVKLSNDKIEKCLELLDKSKFLITEVARTPKYSVRKTSKDEVALIRKRSKVWVEMDPLNEATFPEPFKELEALIADNRFTDGYFHFFAERRNLNTFTSLYHGKEHDIKYISYWRYK